MYAGPASHVDREEYLLGKRIDRQIDPLLASEEKEKEVRRRGWGRGEGGGHSVLLGQALATGPGALFSAPDAANSTADLAIKVREDPLFLIRKKEEEAKKQLASNPVKMKQLQEVCLNIHVHRSLHNSSHHSLHLPQLLAKERHSKHHHKSKKKKKQRERSRSPHRYCMLCGCGCVCSVSCGSAHYRKSSKRRR